MTRLALALALWLGVVACNTPVEVPKVTLVCPANVDDASESLVHALVSDPEITMLALEESAAKDPFGTACKVKSAIEYLERTGRQALEVYKQLKDLASKLEPNG
jgi:hypothetical protein